MRKKCFLQLFAEEQGVTDSVPEDSKSQNLSEPAIPSAKEPAKKYTDEDVSTIINRKFEEWVKKQESKVGEAKKLEEMTAQEKAEYKTNQLEKELNELKKKETIAEMTKTARKMLSESDISVSDELLSMMVSTDAGRTKEAVDSFAKAFNAAVDSAVKEKLRGETPKGKYGGKSTMTKEQIMEIRDPELRQKKMLENRELFNF